MITLSFKLEIRDDHIKLPETLVEVTASVETYADLTDLPNVGAVDGSHVRRKSKIKQDLPVR